MPSPVIASLLIRRRSKSLKTPKLSGAAMTPLLSPLKSKFTSNGNKDGVTSRLITFKVGTFKGVDARISAYYCFPENGKKNPAFVWSHGGGQCADRNRGHYFATQGFATVDINWLGRPLEGAKEGLTDWGKIDPSQGPQLLHQSPAQAFQEQLPPRRAQRGSDHQSA